MIQEKKQVKAIDLLAHLGTATAVLGLVFGGVQTYSSGYANGVSTTSLVFNTKIDILNGQILSLQRQLESTEGAVKFTVGDTPIYLKKATILIDGDNARSLILKGYKIEDNLLFPDYTTRGFTYKECRLKQLISFLKTNTIPLPDSNTPDDEPDPLWWPKCYTFTKETDDGSSQILACTIPVSKFDEVFQSGTDMFLNNVDIKGFDRNALNRMDKPPRSFVIMASLAKDGLPALSSVHFSDGFFLCEGSFDFPDRGTYNFTYTAFETSNEIVCIYIGSSSARSKIDLLKDEVRDFVGNVHYIK